VLIAHWCLSQGFRKDHRLRQGYNCSSSRWQSQLWEIHACFPDDYYEIGNKGGNLFFFFFFLILLNVDELMVRVIRMRMRRMFLLVWATSLTRQLLYLLPSSFSRCFGSGWADRIRLLCLAWDSDFFLSLMVWYTFCGFRDAICVEFSLP